jgi:hypothetical protein
MHGNPAAILAGALCGALTAALPTSARAWGIGIATSVISIGRAGITLTVNGPQSYCAGIETSHEEIGDDD